MSHVNNITEAKKQFLSISDYKDAKEMAERCSELSIRTVYDMV